MSKLHSARIEVPGTLISDYVYREVPDAQELILILHGYSLSGEIMMNKLEPLCPESSAVLAPNAPFPIPERKAAGGYRIGFSWYFYDPTTDEYYIDMKVALEFLEVMVQKLGLSHLPKRVIGFSQGGYLAPFAALQLGNVRQIVGIASEYLPQEIDEVLRSSGRSWKLPFRVDAVHGEQDDVVSPVNARKAHQEMLACGARGEFVGLEGEGHRLSPGVLKAVSEMLRAGD